MGITKEQAIKAASCKSAKELMALAKQEGIELSAEDADKYFAQLAKTKELDSESLASLSGGCSGNYCIGNLPEGC